MIKELWKRTEAFDWNGPFFKLKKVYGLPRPTGRTPIINAGGSGQGRAFAMNNADFLFTPCLDIERSRTEVAALKEQAKEAGRKVGVVTFAHVICRPTEQEAKDYLEYTAVENADEEAIDNLMALQFAFAKSFPLDLLAAFRKQMAAGHGGYLLVGTPQQVGDGILTLHEAGFSGATLSFVDYIKEFPYFRDNVLPILEKAGIRKPARSVLSS